MAEERQLLLTKVFPEIERLCAERGVPFSFVDMNAGLESDILDYESRLQSGFELIDQWFVRTIQRHNFNIILVRVLLACMASATAGTRSTVGPTTLPRTSS